ncbi:hypothetical protein EMN46_09660 [Ancylomarina sp. 16SWW S1-10-2]|nr:hypothetical protein [Ancylomarina sp. 16SWW S1-10-2]
MKLKSTFEEIDLKVPRDRNGTFDPKIIPKRSNTRLGIENRNISLYAKGMTVSDIEQQLIEIYDVNISSSAITCTDNLNGFTSTINSVFPESKTQACVIHQIRNTCKFVSYKDRKSFTSGIRDLYNTQPGSSITCFR